MPTANLSLSSFTSDCLLGKHRRSPKEFIHLRKQVLHSSLLALFRLHLIKLTSSYLDIAGILRFFLNIRGNLPSRMHFSNGKECGQKDASQFFGLCYDSRFIVLTGSVDWAWFCFNKPICIRVPSFRPSCPGLF